MKPDLPDFSAARVLVAGDVMLDRYLSGGTRRISPEAPVPVVSVSDTEDRPGGAANVALSVAALGGQATLVGMAGQDEAGDLLTARLESRGVRTHLQRDAQLPTIVKLRVLSHGQQLIRLDFEESFHETDPAAMQQQFLQALPQAGVVVLSDYNKGALACAATLIQAAREAGVPVLVDPKGTDFARYRGASLITPNMTEFESVVGPCADDDTIVEKALGLIAEFDFDAVLVTRSEKGMSLIRRDLPALHLPTTAVSVADVTGAGDTVLSTLATALAAGADLAGACQFANMAAGVVVTKLGTSTVSRAELAGAMAMHDATGNQVLTREQLKLLVEEARRRGEKVVMTNGCFDILHAGHVSYLNSAAQLGDRLIVAVNSDASVRRLKGETRPVNPLEGRMAVLAGLAAVDWVVPFDEDTPEALIADILPDILVKGGDYRVGEIAGHKQVLANGGEVQILQFEEGISTSRIIRNILNSEGKSE
ncbi:bifunctional D-glycero-beta-D-manno-heptose-7-phosphate kinase/D-glycero-beta-D-manno-heptose 1-phosphate adenylyltransferase HldE [Granulosicoccaceae sp. 1_MG-2023]|nr:bifunctional D-glycero-beta-D-manno-heptose-7-phosphate kinase/D-glycero-beta-D-manno-heptose 1-phosphate adenylyltransferase HldE [Granulosicoccaceae sp. 1_MG-2023]